MKVLTITAVITTPGHAPMTVEYSVLLCANALAQFSALVFVTVLDPPEDALPLPLHVYGTIGHDTPGAAASEAIRWINEDTKGQILDQTISNVTH